MSSYPDCQLCAIVYGMENPQQKILFSTRHFLGMRQNNKEEEIFIFYKRHEAFPKHPDHKPYPPLPEDFNDDLERARNKAKEILNQGAPCYNRWPTASHYYHFQEWLGEQDTN